MVRIRRAWLAVLLMLVLAPGLAWGAGEIPLTGRVLDASGKGLAKASAALVPMLPPIERQKLELAGKLAPDPVTTTVADAEGRFRLLAPGPGAFKVVVSAPGFASEEADLAVLMAPRQVLPFRLERTAGLKVRMLGRDGKPLAGVRVLARRPDDAPRLGRLRYGGIAAAAAGRALTDAVGVATLPVGTDDRLAIAALPPGSPEIERQVAAGSSTVELRAGDGCARRLEVRDAQGKPVAGAVVASAVFPLGMTDAAGLATVTAPCKAPWTLGIATADGAGAQVRLVPAAAGGEVPVQKVVLLPPVRWTGRVLAAETRQPLPGAFVWEDDNAAGFVRTDGKGSYLLSLPAAGKAADVRFHAGLPGYLEAREKGTAAAAAVIPGPTLLLKPTATLAGIVVDRQGKAIAGAEVRAEEAAIGSGPMAFLRRADFFGLPMLATSDEQGGFFLQVLPGRRYTLNATHGRFAPVKLAVSGKLAPLATRSGLRLVMGPGLSAFGRVVDADSQPVAGAEVKLTVVENDESGLPGRRRIILPGLTPAEGYSAVTGGDGGFQIDHLPAGRFDLAAQATGYAPLTVRGLTLGERPEPKDLGTVILTPGAVLEGLVVDAKGRPLAGAAVEAQQAAAGGVFRFSTNRRGGSAEHEARTRADGRFTLQSLTPGEAVDVTVRLAGYVAANQPRVAVPHEQPLRIVLEQAARVSGRVVDEVGEPVSGATASVQPAGRSFPNLPGAFGQSATTDIEGRFQIEDLEPGKMTVTAEATGYLASEPRVVELANGKEVAGLELVVKRGAVVEGIVTLPGGAPAAGAQISLQGGGPDLGGTVIVRTFGGASGSQADGDGHYRLEGVREGTQSVAAELSGYRRAVRDLEVRSGTNRLDLQLGEGFSISGRVTDTSGQPVADATIALTTNGFFPEGQEVSGTDGAFRFAGLNGGRFSLAASKSGYSGAQKDVQITDSSLDNVELQLTAGGGVITGKVTGLEFREISSLDLIAIPRGGTVGIDGMRRGQVDFEGKYRVEGVPAGEWALRGTVAGSGRTAQKNVTMPEGGGVVEVDLEFGGGLTLSGRISRGGRPIADATVFASGLEVEASGNTSSDSNGAYRIEGLKPGRYRLVVFQLDLGVRTERTLTLDTSQELDIELPTARVSGRVTDKGSGAPLSGVPVTAVPATTAGGLNPRTVTDGSGAFTLENLEPGSYRVQASKEGYARGEAQVDIPAPDSTIEGVRLELEPEAGLVVDVASGVGAPPQVSVALLDAGGNAVLVQSLPTGENGRTRIRNAQPGRYQLLVAASGFAPATQPATVPGPPLSVFLQPGGQLVVEVPALTAAGQVATLTLSGANGQPYRALSFGSLRQEWTLTAGTVTIDDLPAGQWNVRIAGPAGQSWQGQVVVVQGGSVRKVF